MRLCKKILFILFLLIIPNYTLNSYDIIYSEYYSLLEFQKTDYPLKKGRPTRSGINYYVSTNKYKILKELEEFIKDTIILDVEISTDDLSQYQGYDTLDLGYHFTDAIGGDEIIIDNRERYVAYDINDLSKLKKLNLSTYNAFVKTTLMHELMHTYFLQIVIESKYNGLDVYKEYDYRMITKIKMFPNVEESYGAEFIEEGVCQYVVEQMKLQIPYRAPIPKTINDVMGNNSIKYTYSVDFLKDFIEIVGLKEAITILITNKPPTYNEILNPDLFYDRLK